MTTGAGTAGGGRGDRVDAVIARLTPEEKVAQLAGVWAAVGGAGEPAPFAPADGPHGTGPADLAVHGVGQLTRPFGGAPVAAGDGARAVADLQRRLHREAPGGVAALVHEECLTGFMTLGATVFPAPLAWGSCWDPDLVEAMGAAIRTQLCSVGVHQGLAPLLDVVRDARWGRVEECIAEDPYLVGVIGCAYIRGLQGDDPGQGVVATAKHFVGYSASEGGRNLAPAHLGPRELSDVFLLPFEMAVTHAGVRSVMSSYQEIDGEPVAASRRLLTDLLRGAWGFDGIVVSDYFSIDWLQGFHGVAADAAEAAALALRAGIDVELPNPSCYGAPLLEAVRRGLVSEADVDRAVGRVLRTKEALGLLDEPAPGPAADVDLDPPGDRALARTVAARSLILLRNEGGLLPLAEDARAVAVIGPNADSGSALLGNYAFENHVARHLPDPPPGVRVVTVAEGIRGVLGNRGTVRTARGCDVTGTDRSGIPAAAGLAAACDVAVVVVGDRAGHFLGGTSGEGSDTDDLALPGAQQALVEAVVASGTPTVVVLVTGRPYDLSWIAANVPALVQCWFPGVEGGAAVADLIFGRTEPGGRTPLTFSRGAGQQPLYYRSRRLGRTRYVGRTARPVFPFGHGLSYTTFEYSDLRLETEATTDGEVTVGCTLANLGPRAGEEVVQLYVRDPVAGVTRPVQELKGFVRVALEPGEEAEVRFAVPADLLAFSGPDLRPVVEPGVLEWAVGASSADIRLQGTVTLRGPAYHPAVPRRLVTGTEVRRRSKPPAPRR